MALMAAPRLVVALLMVAGATTTLASAQPRQDEPPQGAPQSGLLPRHNTGPGLSSQPLYMQADQLIYDTRNNRVIAQGNVELYHKNSILIADRVTFDSGTNDLVADGHVQLKAPDGSITRSDRLRLPDEFRDAFRESVNQVSSDPSSTRTDPVPK